MVYFPNWVTLEMGTPCEGVGPLVEEYLVGELGGRQQDAFNSDVEASTPPLSKPKYPTAEAAHPHPHGQGSGEVGSQPPLRLPEPAARASRSFLGQRRAAAPPLG